MPTNDIKPFATGGGANVIDQATFLALTARTSGFSAGIAQSDQLNKVWRQSAFMAAILAQFIVNETSSDVLDDGDVTGKVALLLAAVRAANNGVISFNTRTGAITLTAGDVTTALGYVPVHPTDLATTGAVGVVQLASGAELTAGVNAAKAVTPSTLAGVLQFGKYSFARDVSAAGNTPNIILVPNVNTPTDGMVVVYIQLHDNTGAVSITLGAGSAKAIKAQGANLAAGQLLANHAYMIMFDATADYWQLLSVPA